MNNTLYQPTYIRPPFTFKVRHAWAVVGLFFAISNVAALPLVLVIPLSTIFKGSNVADTLKNITLVVANLVTYVGLFWIVFKLCKRCFNGKPLLELSKVSISTYLLLFVFTVAFAIVVEPASTAMDHIPLPDALRELMDKLKEFVESMLKPSVAMFFMAVIIAPIGEEVMMRGIILRGLLKSYSPQKAIFLSAFLFAVIHLNPWQGIFAFIIGSIFGWVYWKTRSILPTIFMHFINNALAFFGMLYVGEENASKTLQELVGDKFLPIFLAAAVISLAVGGIIYVRHRKGVVSVDDELTETVAV